MSGLATTTAPAPITPTPDENLTLTTREVFDQLSDAFSEVNPFRAEKKRAIAIMSPTESGRGH